MYVFLLISVLITNSFAEGEWWSTFRSHDEKNYYYVGVAEGKESVPQLQDKAFNKAMGELIREHFGMNIQINESSVEGLKKQQFNVVTKQSSAPLFIKGVGIFKTREKDLDDKGIRVYVQIQADKKAIEEAIQNQITKPGNDSLNSFGETHDSKTDITVKTHPQGAFIHFSHLDRRYSLQGQGDARFYLPRGRYQMVVSRPGYATVSKEIRLEMQGMEENIILDELSGTLDLEVYPDDARIFNEGQRLSPGKHPVTVAKIHKFKISHPDYFPKEIDLILENPETIHKVVKLDPKPSNLKYEVYPAHAAIYIDGKRSTFYKGKTDVDPGKKKILITAPGYFPYEEEVYVGTNREYPIKVVKLILDDERIPPSSKRASVRVEVNPLFGVANVGYGGLGFALHFEYYYLSLGAGFDLTQYKESKDHDRPNSLNTDKEERETSVSDGYLTARLISPQFGAFKFFGSATYGTYSRTVEDMVNKTTLHEESKTFTGLGGGFRGYLTPKWSFHAEYFDIEATHKETKLKSKEHRILAGFSYEF